MLRSATTSNQYQSTFMPIFSDAEARIKRLVVFAFWVKMPKLMLVNQIMQVIAQVKKDIPKDLYDREAYINGLVKSSNRIIKEYDKANRMFQDYRTRLVDGDGNGVVRFVKSPEDLHSLMTKQTPSERKLMWSEAKGSPNVQDYENKVKEFINKVSERPFVTDEKGKHSISLWQKAELDVRYNKQLDMLQELTDTGVELAYISSHPDCSKRCEVWQGKLVSLTKHAKNPQKVVKDYKYDTKSFICDKVNGRNVYSLLDIMDCETGYGYKNNIITGFNCRHKLTPYTEGKQAPTHYTKEQVQKQRAIEQNIRLKERKIRLLKMKANDYTIIGDKAATRVLDHQVKVEVAQYKRYCERNGYAWYKYRIDVNDNNIYLRGKPNE